MINVVNAQKNVSSGNVVAKNRDISDNLDLQAVASIFGDAKDLEDFEKKLNDSSLQISNLDLNQDGYVDYLRVLEVAEGDTRVIVIQAVLGQDQFQDVATIELEKQRSTASSSESNVNIQIVGNPYIYGPNYIYEPYYYRQPVFFDFFWMSTYRPYYSPWYWGYYPTYYSYWAPVPYFRYNRNCYYNINQNNRYVYTDTRRVSRADRMYSNVRGNSLERQNPGRSFEGRNANISNRYAFDKERTATRTANFNTDRVGGNVDKANFSSNRGNANVGRNTVESTRANITDGNRAAVSSDVRSTGTKVRSDFSSNRVNGNSETRVSLPSNSNIQNTRINSNSTRSNVNSVPTSNSRIERTSRVNSDSNSRSTNSGSFNRSSNSGSFNRMSSPAPSRSMSAPSSRSGGGSSGRSIGR